MLRVQTPDLLPPHKLQPCSSSTRQTGRTPQVFLNVRAETMILPHFHAWKAFRQRFRYAGWLFFLPPLTQRYISGIIPQKNMLITIYDDMEEIRWKIREICENCADFTHPRRNSLITQCGASPLVFAPLVSKMSATGFLLTYVPFYDYISS